MQLFNYLKFFLIFLYTLIKDNIVKSICLAISITIFQFAGTFSDGEYIKDVVQEIEVNGDYLYVSEKITNDDNITYELNDFKEPQKVENGKLIYYEYSQINVLMWALFAFSTFIVGLMTILGWSGEDDSGWHSNESYKNAISKIIYCVEENGIFYYMSFGRLLSKRDNQLSRYDICRSLGIRSLSDIRFCPKFQTKTQKRENLLTKIGIN